MFNTRPYPNGGHVLDANHQVNNNIQKEVGRGRKGWFHSYLYSLDGSSQNGVRWGWIKHTARVKIMKMKIWVSNSWSQFFLNFPFSAFWFQSSKQLRKTLSNFWLPIAIICSNYNMKKTKNNWSFKQKTMLFIKMNKNHLILIFLIMILRSWPNAALYSNNLWKLLLDFELLLKCYTIT